MDKFELPEGLINSFKEIAKIQEKQQREANTMLVGFIATNEQDLKYMDTYMDCLYDFVEPGSDTEELLRKYITYVATFNSIEAKERVDDLEDTLGYKTKIVYAAGLLAQRLHAGQLDKGGNDYFTSHLLTVGKSGIDWKEQVTGFLHDAAEDCNVTVEEVMTMLEQEIKRVVNNGTKFLEEAEWWKPWMEDIMNYPAEETHLMTAEEREEISQVLRLMNHHTAATREEYINRFAGNRLAIRTKLNDLRSNMDMRRLASPTQKDLDRRERYQREYDTLLKMLRVLSPDSEQQISVNSEQ